MNKDAIARPSPQIRVCFVCLGNICRSPTAEGVMRHLVEEHGLTGAFTIDSAGTDGYHVGERPDPRTRAAAAKRGIRVDGQARQFKAADFNRFDYVVAMDRSNLRRLGALAPTAEARAKLSLLRDHDPQSPPGSEVPDPYYGGEDGFDEVLDICEAGCRGMLERLRATYDL